MSELVSIKEEIKSLRPITYIGRVRSVCSQVVHVSMPGVALGDTVEIHPNNSAYIKAQVVGFEDGLCLLMAYGQTEGIMPGSKVTALKKVDSFSLSSDLLGLVVNGRGSKLIRLTSPSAQFSKLPIESSQHYGTPPKITCRRNIEASFETGVRAIDGLLTVGMGQRLALLAQAGVGKSSLISTLSKNSSADVNVIALIGERAREVDELFGNALDEQTKAKTVFVVSTSDQSALLRAEAANTATLIAEYFRAQGLNVLLLVDSLTRLFRAYREIGAAAGEPSVRRGYPASVFSKLPYLLERAGRTDTGSITAFYSVLLSDEMEEDPMVEETVSITDGHITLSKDLAESGHYPAIDIPRSISRLANKLQKEEIVRSGKLLRALISRLQNDKELAMLSSNLDTQLKVALNKEGEINSFLKQDLGEKTTLNESQNELLQLAAELEDTLQTAD